METTFRDDERRPITATLSLPNNGKIDNDLIPTAAVQRQIFSPFTDRTERNFFFATTEFENVRQSHNTASE